MSLKFIPKISRYANLYFFIQNLSEWHFSNRKKHNEVWRKELSFSPEADFCIQAFGKIHEKYSFGPDYLGRPFFLKNDPLSAVELIVGKDSTAKIKNIFSTIEPYFDALYTKDEIMLKKWASIIADPEFVEKSSFINNTLANFYGCPPYNESCTIYLLLSTKEKNGGTSGTIDSHSITLELSRTPIESEEQVLKILWHELIHLYFRKYKFYPLLERYTDNNLEIMSKIDELVASALLPNGLLRQNLLVNINESKTPESFNSRITSDKIISIQKLIYPYLKEKKVIDAKLIKEICMIGD